MAPEWVILVTSTVCALLMTLGGVLVGWAKGEMGCWSHTQKLQASLSSAQRSAQEALAKADAAKVEADSLRTKANQHAEDISRDTKAPASEELMARLEATEAKLSKALISADEADKEFTIVREKLDKTEKRLAEANRRLADRGDDDGGMAGALEAERTTTKRLTERLEKVEKERDDAMERVKSLASKLRAQEDAATKAPSEQQMEALRQEVEVAKERVAVSERVMEGVRARSAMLSQELKKVKAELAALKG
ncbi:MAG TPA: hypothetical protein PLJ27_20110 [Polyangiaceae bacterium]|mgnify:CR=1 FL=1|nr:MAG: hypothetical protein BWY17_02281 [Deltaproteobacteria bacterium ADurb.Bin207]HNS97785.1 hypothetical protein [Polyangiaceae bacterium]HNZ23925.1 hypothetical protein [Polyangiaceae bacterium]HOD23340.1 hypothetical protein [Polyangiaceae bacterium]HOE50071.1 hypothetical protein [Polyangiaceae bacterium]